MIGDHPIQSDRDSKDSTGSSVLLTATGFLLAVVLPPAGFVIGLLLLRRKCRKTGWGVISIAVFVTVFGFTAFVTTSLVPS